MPIFLRSARPIWLCSCFSWRALALNLPPPPCSCTILSALIANPIWGNDERLDRRTGPSGRRVGYRLEPVQGGTAAGRCISNTTSPPARPAIGWRISLPDLDASAYDHLELWIRGDEAAGFAQELKMEFKQPLPNTPPGLLRQGSTVVAGITSDWQRFRVPLNRMNGIDDWRHLRQFGIVLQPRRSPVRAGAYWLDDIALIKTGEPGPSIRDPVIPPQKTAWENQLGGKEAAQPHIHARLAGWPERLLVDPAERSATTRSSCGNWRAIPGAGWRRSATVSTACRWTPCAFMAPSNPNGPGWAITPTSPTSACI